MREEYVIVPEGDANEVEDEPEDEEEEGCLDLINANDEEPHADQECELVDLDGNEDEDLGNANFRWRKHEIDPICTTFSDDSLRANEVIKEPVHYFQGFFDEEIITDITYQTNLYSIQSNQGQLSTTITTEEIRKYLGILLIMGIYKISQYRMYWSPGTKVEIISSAMSINRFETIKRYLHFNDSSSLPEKSTSQYDKLFKVKPLL